MDIEKQLLVVHSKENALYITDHVISYPEKTAELVRLFLGQDNRITQRASQVVGMLFDRKPDLILPYLGQIIANLENDINDAVKRNTVRLLQNQSIPEEYEALVANKCFDYLTGKEPIAVKAFSMTVLANLTQRYPDFRHELETIIKDLMQEGSAGIKARGKAVLAQLAKLD